MIKVLVAGSGRMGREVLAAVVKEDDMEPAGCIDALSGEEYVPVAGHELVPMGRETATMIVRTRPDVIVDFTNADFTPKLAKDALEAGVRMVIGTSGLNDGFVKDLEAGCAKRKVGAVIAPNFALGAILMQHMARLASRYFDNAEILEMHHDAKIDAPSGTSIATARAMAEARKEPFIVPATKKETIRGSRGGQAGNVPIHSVRLPGLVAHQQVMFGAPGETLTIRHDTIDRISFMPGVVLAIREVMKRDHLVFGLDQLMDLG